MNVPSSGPPLEDRNKRHRSVDLTDDTATSTSHTDPTHKKLKSSALKATQSTEMMATSQAISSVDTGLPANLTLYRNDLAAANSNPIVDTVKMAAEHIYKIYESQLAIAQKRVDNAKTLEEQSHIWAELGSTNTVKALSDICQAGINLLATQAVTSPTTYASTVSKNANITVAKKTSSFSVQPPQLTMKPVGDWIPLKTTTDYFWDVLQNKSIQVTSIVLGEDYEITVSFRDHEGAKRAFDLLMTAELNAVKYAELFEIKLKTNNAYFIKTLRIKKKELFTTSIMNGDVVDRDKLVQALIAGNPWWFKSPDSFDIMDADHLAAIGDLPEGYAIKVRVNKDVFIDYIQKRRQIIVLDRILIPSFPMIRTDICFRCLDFGHGADTCRKPQLCRRCGGSHRANHKKCAEPKVCINCTKHNEKVAEGHKGPVYPTDHIATSNSCNILRERMNELIDILREEHDA